MLSPEGERQTALGSSCLVENVRGTVCYAQKEKKSTRRREDRGETHAAAQNTLRITLTSNVIEEAMKPMAKVVG